MGQLGVIVTGYADTIMVGNYNTTALASASYVNFLINLVLMMSLGFSYGLTPLVGALFGKGDKSNLGAMVRGGLLLNVLYVLVLMIPMLVVYLMLDHMGLPEHLVPVIRPYLMIITLSMIPVAAVNAFKQFTDAINDTKVSMYILVAGNALNIVLNYLLIYGHFGAPELGLYGAGLATFIARVMMITAYFIYIFCHPTYREYRHDLLHSNPGIADLRKIFKTSLPTSIQMGLETFIFTVAAIFAGWLGAIDLATIQVLNVMGQIGFMVYYSLGAATSIKMSNYYGLGNIRVVKDVSHAGYVITLISSVVACSIFYFFGGTLASIFSNDPEVVSLVMATIGLLILYQLGDATQIAFANSLRGISYVKPIMSQAFISYVIIGIPVMYLLCFTLNLRLSGIYLALGLALLVAGIFFYVTFNRRIKQLQQA